MNLPNQSKLPLVMLVEAGLAPYECHSYFLPMLRSSCVILASILLLRIGKGEGSCSGLGQGLLRPGLISSVLIMFLQVIYVHPRAVSVLTRVEQAGLVTRRDSCFFSQNIAFWISALRKGEGRKFSQETFCIQTIIIFVSPN